MVNLPCMGLTEDTEAAMVKFWEDEGITETCGWNQEQRRYVSGYEGC